MQIATESRTPMCEAGIFQIEVIFYKIKIAKKALSGFVRVGIFTIINFNGFDDLFFKLKANGVHGELVIEYNRILMKSARGKYFDKSAQIGQKPTRSIHWIWKTKVEMKHYTRNLFPHIAMNFY